MKLLVAIGAVLVIGAVALVLMMSKADETPPSKQPTTTTQTAEKSGVTVTSTDRGAPPKLPDGTVAAAGSDQVKEYMVGDVKVRDHRTGEHAPRDLPPNPHPANSRALPTALTQDISQQVKTQLFECAREVPKTARGTKPKLEGTLAVSIKDHKLSITSLDSQIRDIDGPSADALKQCVQQKSASFTANAPKEEDLDRYTIGLSFAIP